MLLSKPDENLGAVHVCLTKNCAYQCRHCKVHSETPIEDRASPKRWKKRLRILKEYGKSFFFGGKDAYEHPFLKKIISHVHHKTVYVSAFPNAPDFVKHLAELGQMHVSMNYIRDSLPTTHSEAQAYYAKRAIDQVLELNPATKVSVHCTISSLNVHELLGIYRYCCNKGFFPSFSFLHADTDGKFDTLRSITEPLIQEMLISKQYHLDAVNRFTDALYIDIYRNNRSELQYLTDILSVELKVRGKGVLTEGVCNCEGRAPLSVNPNGRLRLCPLRQGERVAEGGFKVASLLNPDRKAEFDKAREQDAKECPGCMMTIPFEIAFFKRNRLWEKTDVQGN